MFFLGVTSTIRLYNPLKNSTYEIENPPKTIVGNGIIKGLSKTSTKWPSLWDLS